MLIEKIKSNEYWSSMMGSNKRVQFNFILTKNEGGWFFMADHKEIRSCFYETDL